MQPTARYKQLLTMYHTALDLPHAERSQALSPLVAEMDRLWKKLGPDGDGPQVKHSPKQQALLAEAGAMYGRRIGDG